ncbi:MAG: potassium transporter TrkG [Fervidicoccaceae archaeon]
MGSGGSAPRRPSTARAIAGHAGRILLIASSTQLAPGILALSLDLLEAPGSRESITALAFVALSSFVVAFVGALRSLRSSIACALFLSWVIGASLSGALSRVSTCFLAVGTSTLLAGLTLTRLERGRREPGTREAILVVVLTWFLVPPISALPAWLALRMPFVDLWFESVSGFTTTGFTIFDGGVDHAGVRVPRVEELHPALILWRAFAQWVGGLGIVVLSLVLFTRPGLAVVRLAEAETRLERIGLSVRATLREMLKLYAVITVIALLALTAAGLRGLDSLALALAGVATGGFSTSSNSVQSIASAEVLSALIIAMVLGASNFNDLHRAVSERRSPLASPELKAMAVIIALWTPVGAAILWSHGRGSMWDSLEASLFHVVSALTTTGFQSMDLSSAPVPFKALLLPLMISGGSVFSTAGGIKLMRVLILARAALEEAAGLERPPGLLRSMRLGRYEFAESEIMRAAVVLALYLGLALAGYIYAVIRLAESAPTFDLLFDVVSASCNVGLSAGVIGSGLPVDLKVLLGLIFTAGRLEVLPLLYIAGSATRRRI